MSESLSVRKAPLPTPGCSKLLSHAGRPSSLASPIFERERVFGGVEDSDERERDDGGEDSDDGGEDSSDDGAMARERLLDLARAARVCVGLR